MPISRPPCRSCGSPLESTFVDLGMSPLCESYVTPEKLNQAELFYPLHAYVCGECFLVQLEEYVSPEHIFSDYAYFSSYSDAWLSHCEEYVAAITKRLGLDHDSRVLELASNDGYLLQYFVERGIPAIGVEPAANIARVAEAKGVETLVEFFDDDFACWFLSERGPVDLVIGNNVLAQVPDLNSFVAGIRTVLRPDGVVTLEVPHLLNLMEGNQFDTIYHEHFSYFSLGTLETTLRRHELRLFDVEELWTHGGSLRVYGCPRENDSWATSPRVEELLRREREAGLLDLDTYTSFAEQVKETKRKLLAFLIEARARGKQIVGYGAPGKGNTLLNYCGIGTDFLAYTVDRSPHKQGLSLPGSRIPIFAPERIEETKPDYVLILPWNFKDEIIEQMRCIGEWGGQFVVPIPEIQVCPPAMETCEAAS